MENEETTESKEKNDERMEGRVKSKKEWKVKRIMKKE